MFWSNCDKTVHLQLFLYTTFFGILQLRL